MIPTIGHYDVHLRDRLSDIARGTPLEKVKKTFADCTPTYHKLNLNTK